MYKSQFSKYEQGTRIEKFVSTKTAINLLKLYKDYYNECKWQILIHDKF